MSMTPIRYDDPQYGALARRYEGELGLPNGILDAIRTVGERSNANQVSEANARSVYQFIPATRRGMIRNYGVDPWQDAESATKAAGLLLKENYQRYGDWDKATTAYHGGHDRRNWGSRTRAYANRVNNAFDGDATMPQNIPTGYYGEPPVDPLAPMPDGYNPLAPEKPKNAVPIPGDPGPSASVPAASQVASRKRGGILGALESVFMPDPDSRWAAALRGGIWDAKANQQAYKAGIQKQTTEQGMADAKLKNLLTKGEYQIAGNNIVHFPPGGGEPEIIAPPQQPAEKERLIDIWRTSGDPSVKQLIERMLTGANSDARLQSNERVAGIRAGATTGAARIRASTVGRSKPTASSTKPPAGFILD